LKRLPSRLFIGVTVFLAVFFFTSCSGSPTQSPISSATVLVAQGLTVTPSSPLIAAKVNDQVILLSDLDQRVNRLLESAKAAGEAQPTDMDAYRLQVLDGMIQQVLIEQAAAIQKVVVTDADVEAEFQLNVQAAGSKDKLMQQLANDKLTEPEFRADLRSTLISLKMRDIVTKDSCVNVEQVQARHILVADEPTAKDIKAQLDKGADFAALAKQYSLDVTTKQIGGDLGWFARGQLLQKSVEDAAFALQKGQISDPVKSDLGYHIIQTLDRSNSRQIDPQTCADLSQRAFERWIGDLISKSKIEKYPRGQAN